MDKRQQKLLWKELRKLFYVVDQGTFSYIYLKGKEGPFTCALKGKVQQEEEINYHTEVFFLQLKNLIEKLTDNGCKITISKPVKKIRKRRLLGIVNTKRGVTPVFR